MALMSNQQQGAGTKPGASASGLNSLYTKYAGAICKFIVHIYSVFGSRQAVHYPAILNTAPYMELLESLQLWCTIKCRAGWDECPISLG